VPVAAVEQAAVDGGLAPDQDRAVVDVRAAAASDLCDSSMTGVSNAGRAPIQDGPAHSIGVRTRLLVIRFG
jgi:hypothetical protein